MPRRRLWSWLLLVVVLLGGGGYFMHLRGNAARSADEGKGGPGGPGGRRERSDKPQPVILAEVASGDIRVVVPALGSLVPRNQAVVRARVDGLLLKLAFREGQAVKAGDLLAEIDPQPFQVALTQAEGQMARDAALLANARTDLARYKALLAQDSIAQQQVDTQDALVRQYEGTVLADKGSVASARLQLSYCHVTAPIAGNAGLRVIDAGNMVHAADTAGIVSIAQTSPITAVFAVPEERLQAILARQRKSPLTVEAWDREQRHLLGSGKLIATDSLIDTTTGTIKLKAEFANADGSLFPNQFVNVRLLLDRLDGVRVVPTAALQQGAKGSYVYRLGAGNKVAVVPVKLGAVDGDRAAVEEGLALGDKVVVDGVDKLRDGASVEAISADAANAPGRPTKRREGGGGRPPR